MPKKPQPVSTINQGRSGNSKKQLRHREETEKSLETTKTLRAPSFLDPDAKKEWKRLIRLYDKMEADILSDLDRNALAVYCTAWAIWHKLQQKWKDKGYLSDSDLKTMKDQTVIMTKYNEQLCLSPVGRAKMGLIHKDRKGKLEKMMEDQKKKKGDH